MHSPAQESGWAPVTGGNGLDVPDLEDMLALRVDALKRLVVTTILLGIVWYGYLGLVVEVTDLGIWSSPICLVVTGILTAHTLRHRSFLTAVLLYIGGLIGANLLAIWFLGLPQLLMLLAIPAGAMLLLVGPAAGFGLAAVLILSVMAMDGRLITPEVRQLTPIFIGLVTLLFWLATDPLRMAIRWAWMGYERANAQMAQAREQRADLMHLTKELEVANRRLKSMALELERARQAANAARRLKAEFAANISHELRTPLNLIIGFSEMMVMAPQTYGVPLPSPYRGDVQAIYRNARHLSNLIDDVLDLSQIEAGRMGLIREPVPVQQIITEAVDTVAPLFHTKGLWLRLELPDNLPMVEADRTRIRQVLINLLNNAARYTAQGGVTISAAADNLDVTIHVADTGIGIAPEDLPHVFEEFRQFDGALHYHHGSGLGLAISKRFVELHGGRMWVTSQRGEGSTFSFSLPIQAELGISHTAPDWETWVRLPVTSSGKPTIVILDRQGSGGKLVARYLDEYRVVLALDEYEIRLLAEREVITAVILIASGGEDGWSELRSVRERLPNIPVLVCTLRGGPQVTAPPGVAAYLMKPVSQEQFQAALDRVGEQARRVLIVDDNREVVRLLSRMVQRASRPYEVVRAYSGDQALQILRREAIDVVVLDLLMPETDGYEVLTQLQADPTLSHIPVIVVSAKGLEAESIMAGLVGITCKEGFSIGEMMRFLKTNLDALRGPRLIHTGPQPGGAPVGSRAS